jgi:hypothetical protein
VLWDVDPALGGHFRASEGGDVTDDPGDASGAEKAASLFDHLLREIIDRLPAGTNADEMPALIDLTADTAASAIVKQLRRTRRGMLAEHRAIRRGFETRLRDPWGPAFDLLETLYVIAMEGGENYVARVVDQANAEDDYVFTVLARLHARACHVVSEIYALLRTGHGAGAHARWRTLHEIAVVASFVADRGQDVARRYLEHVGVTAWHDAQDYQSFAPRLGMEPYSAEEMDELDRVRAELIAKYGKDFDRDWGWAAAELAPLQPTLRSLELAVDLDCWRPNYRVASHGVHGGPRALLSRLGVPDAVGTLIVGPSNAGLSDAGQDAAITLRVICTRLLAHRADLEGSTTARIIGLFAQDTVDAFVRAEQEMDRRIASEQAQAND